MGTCFVSQRTSPHFASSRDSMSDLNFLLKLKLRDWKFGITRALWTRSLYFECEIINWKYIRQPIIDDDWRWYRTRPRMSQTASASSGIRDTRRTRQRQYFIVRSVFCFDIVVHVHSSVPRGRYFLLIIRWNNTTLILYLSLVVIVAGGYLTITSYKDKRKSYFIVSCDDGKVRQVPPEPHPWRHLQRPDCPLG